MSELFLNKEQVEEFSYADCTAHMKLLSKAYNLNKPLKDCFVEVWPVLDQICDTLLYIEDRMARFEDPRIPSMDPEQEIVKPVLPVKLKRSERKFRALDVVYASIHAAALATGVKVHTLRNYVIRSPDRYAYID